MAIEVYNGLYSGQELDAAVTVVNAVIPSTATAQNQLATASDISGITEKIPSGASSSNQLATASDVSTVSGSVSAIEAKIPSGASSGNKMATASDITSITEKIPSGASSSNQLATASDITGITNLIPAEATTTNKLADKAFVNSSIGTNTGNYISDNGNPFTSLASLEAYTGTVHNNDYAFVTGTDTYGNEYYDRYKATVSGSTVTWAKEYRLNNSTFTATQWAAVNSGITADLIPSGASSSNQFATASDISGLSTDISGINDKIPSGASSSNKMATASDITGITDMIPSGASSSNQLATASDITGITQLIPSTATTSNKLATMADIPGGGGGIAGVQINGVDLTPDSNNKVDIPMSGSMVLGVIKTSPSKYCTDIGTSGSTLTGELCASEVQYADYASLDDSAFIAKGTLDNVLAGMSLDDVSDETWTFVVDDGQGGTTTITKTVKVGT